MILEDLIPIIEQAAKVLAWVFAGAGAIISVLIGVIWRSRAKQTDMLIASTQSLNESVSVLNVTMLEVRDATAKQWKKLSKHDIDIAILKAHQNGNA
jgi:hypothetical protein